MVSSCSYLRFRNYHITVPLPCGIDVNGVHSYVVAFIFFLSYMTVDHIPNKNLSSRFLLVFSHLGPLYEEVI